MTKENNHKPKQKTIRIKTCRLCEESVNYVDFKNPEILHKFHTEGGRILSRRITGTCKYHQAMIAKAIKKARNIALAR